MFFCSCIVHRKNFVIPAKAGMGILKVEYTDCNGYRPAPV